MNVKREERYMKKVLEKRRKKETEKEHAIQYYNKLMSQVFKNIVDEYENYVKRYKMLYIDDQYMTEYNWAKEQWQKLFSNDNRRRLLPFGRGPKKTFISDITELKHIDMAKYFEMLWKEYNDQKQKEENPLP